jgi:hypothetical protein
MSALKWIALIAVIAAGICVPIVVFTHHTLMPDAAQLDAIDAAAQASAPHAARVRRLPSPDRVESDGHSKFGYFTYEVSDVISTHKYQAQWRITEGKVEIISFKRL